MQIACCQGFQVVLGARDTPVRVRAAPADGGEAVDYRLMIRRGFPAALTVHDNRFVQVEGSPHLDHNIPNLEVTLGDEVFRADFRTHFEQTGGIERWGYPISEVLVLEPNALTQFYQRGAVDYHETPAGWVLERRLAWDYLGGGLAGSADLGVEEHVTNQFPGRSSGPWGHKVSNYAIDGTETGFADFYDRLGGEKSFGFPKSDARKDSNAPGTLHLDELTPGFIRQYFQAAVFEYHPGDVCLPGQADACWADRCATGWSPIGNPSRDSLRRFGWSGASSISRSSSGPIWAFATYRHGSLAHRTAITRMRPPR